MAHQSVADPDNTTGVSALECVVVTPEATALQMPAKFVAVPLYDGELGIAPGHSPFIGRLGFGELRVVHAGQAKRMYVDGGFVQVVDNQVAVITNHAIPAEKLDATAAREQLEAAQRRPSHTPELMAIRERAELQARAQLRMVEGIHSDH